MKERKDGEKERKEKKGEQRKKKKKGKVSVPLLHSKRIKVRNRREYGHNIRQCEEDGLEYLTGELMVKEVGYLLWHNELPTLGHQAIPGQPPS